MPIIVCFGFGRCCAGCGAGAALMATTGDATTPDEGGGWDAAVFAGAAYPNMVACDDRSAPGGGAVWTTPTS